MTKLLPLFALSLLLMTVDTTAMQDGVPTTSDDLESEEFEGQQFNTDEEQFYEDDITEDTGGSKNPDTYYSPNQHLLLAPAYFTLRYELAYGIEDPKKLVINRPSLRLQWEKSKGNFFIRFDGKTDKDFVYNRAEFNNDVKERYGHQTEVREFYLQASKGAFSMKLGRQLVVWGKADGGIVTDIMSPRDLTELVFTTVEDARIGQDMFVVDAYYQNVKTQAQHQWSLIITPYIKVNDIALAGHPYGIDIQSTSLFPSSTQVVDERPEASWSQPEIGVRWGVTTGKMDWSMMAAEVHEDNPVFTLEMNAPSQDILRAQYPRYQMLGLGFNRSHGSFVWKGELAFKNNRRFNFINQLHTEQYRVFDSVFGFDFNANGLYTVSVELSNQHVVDWDSRLIDTRRDETVAYAIWSRPWLNETLTTQYTASAQLQDRESFHRFEVQYDLNDQWSAEIQMDYFDSNLPDSLFGQLRDKHRVSVRVDFNF